MESPENSQKHVPALTALISGAFAGFGVDISLFPLGNEYFRSILLNFRPILIKFLMNFRPILINSRLVLFQIL